MERIRDVDQQTAGANRLERLGVDAFNKLQTQWARFYFERAVRLSPDAGADIGLFYQASAQQEVDPSAAYGCHRLAKRFFKKGTCHQDWPSLYANLAYEYEELAARTPWRFRRTHWQERAAYYRNAAASCAAGLANDPPAPLPAPATDPPAAGSAPLPAPPP